MKKLSLLFITIFTSFFAFSQITITDDNVYLLGDEITYYKLFDIDETFDVGSAGENITWNFSAQSESGTTEFYEYTDPTGKPHVDEMPSIDLAERLDGNNNSFFYFDNNGGTEWNRSGVYVNDSGTEMWWHYENNSTPEPLQLTPYPFTYNTEITTDPFGGHGGYDMSGSQDELVIPNNGSYHFECDGYGTLILPHKIYTNALRVHVTESFTINLLMGGTPVVSMDLDDDAYYWYVEGVKGPVMSFIHSVTNSSSGEDHSYNAKWYRADVTEITTDFTVNSQTGNTDDIFNFTNLSEPLNQGSTFLWEFSPATVTFEGGTDATSAHPQVSFDEPGLYTVTLTTTNSNFTPDFATETKTDYMDITAAPQLVADFTADDTNPALNGAVNFTATVNDEAGTTYHWAVSPGVNGTHYGYTNFTTDTDQNPQITFYQAGCYSIQFIATNSNYSNSPVTVTKMNYINAGGGCGDAYTVTFTVTDGTNPINGAEVAVSGYSPVTTNSSGVATIDLYNGNYNFDVTASGFGDYSSSFTVSDDDLPVDVVMNELTAYTVTFTVTDGSSPINGAEITVTGESSVTTNSSGVATIDLYDGNYNFNVTASGYGDYSSSFTVDGANFPVNVTMTVGIETLIKNNIKLYPNPTTGMLNINSDEPLLITIFDISGKQIYLSKQANKTFEIDLSNNSKGLYFINIIKNNKVFMEKIILN